ncbi:MAG: hypothetical protein FWG64_10380 [Firmicutes bacterium]|nr:hypothetical protein [Bacillota bacterium]
MKKLRISVLLFALILISSCIPTIPEIPVGVWKSDTFDLILYLEEYALVNGNFTFAASIVLDDTEIKSFIYFNEGSEFLFHEMPDLSETGGFSGYYQLFAGVRYLQDDMLILSPYPIWRRRLGLRERRITLHRTYEYEPINIEDWLILRSPSWTNPPQTEVTP